MNETQEHLEESSHRSSASSLRRVSSFHDLVAWQKAIDLGVAVHKMTAAFPEQERFGLTLSLRNAAVAVPSRIAEGYGCGGRAEYLELLKRARAAIHEIDTLCELAVRLTYLSDDDYDQMMNDIDDAERVLAGLIRSLERPRGRRMPSSHSSPQQQSQPRVFDPIDT